MSNSDRLLGFDEAYEPSEPEIQVSGYRIFPLCKWRDAIRYYLNGRRDNLEEVVSRPKIAFPDATLSLSGNETRYEAYIHQGESERERKSDYTEAEKLVISSNTEEVERGLLRLVEDDGLKELVIRFTDSGDRFVSLIKVRGTDFLTTSSKGLLGNLDLWLDIDRGKNN
jgi:hypothetical protein